jgi:polysaccharide biosynthesis protein PslG
MNTKTKNAGWITSRQLFLTVAISWLFGSAVATPLAAANDIRSDNSPWGIASGAEWAKDYPRFDPLLHDAGITWLRYFPEWQTNQPAKGEWNWTYADPFVATATENQIRIAGVFGYAAKWATTDGGTRRMPLKDNQDWRDYVTGTVSRFKGTTQYWEVWNEFNGSFASGEKTPKVYADLVRDASEAAKRIDPNAKIGMSVANFSLGFLDAAIKAGAAGHFDYLAVHPYENLGAAIDGGEMGFLSLAGSLRKMLRDNNQRADMPLWITEIGVQSSVLPDAEKDARQADALVMCYVLSIAQGFDKIFWFEARGPSYGKGTDHGIIRKDWSLRPVYHAFKNMTTLLGAEPSYLGWVNVGGNGYGFVFQSARGPVLVSWAVKGTEGTTQSSFASPVRVLDVLGNASLVPEGQPVTLTRSPIYVTLLPPALVAQAKANHDKDFPWGVDYSKVDTARISLGATNREDGIKQNKLTTTDVVHGLDWSARKSNNLKGGESHFIYFRVDPTFAGFGNSRLEITVVARRATQEKAVGIALTYESLSGYKGIKGGRWEIPAGEEWIEHTWTVDDANFVGGWGWNFRTDAGGSSGEFQVKEVRVKKLPATQ